MDVSLPEWCPHMTRCQFYNLLQWCYEEFGWQAKWQWFNLFHVTDPVVCLLRTRTKGISICIHYSWYLSDNDEQYKVAHESAHAIAPDSMYGFVLRAIIRMPFLHVLEASEITRTLNIESSREKDPKGLLKITVSKRGDSVNACTLRIMLSDNKFMRDLQADKIVFRPNVKGTLTQILLGNIYLIAGESKLGSI